LEVMIAEVSQAIHSGEFRWKPRSLQVMAGGDAADDDFIGIECTDVDGTRLPFKAVKQMIMLGEVIDNQGSTASSVSYRLTRAEGNFWSHSREFMAATPVAEKLSAWCQGPRSSAMFGAINWHLTGETLHGLWSWELTWLRKSLKLRRRHDEHHVESPHLWREGRRPR